jgi:ATP-binding cassette, subfamily C, bacterial CydC
VAVSGGEARRIALARVLLKDAPILLLDEQTEGLDAETERAVLDALQPLIAGRTVITISHRPAALSAMDRVVRLEGGRLIEVASTAVR